MDLKSCLTVFLSYLVILLSCPASNARKEQKRKLEILHGGKPLEELVSLNTRVDPHDIKDLAQTIEPKLMEETHQERSETQNCYRFYIIVPVMLQQNGIEDPYPLDATIEYEEKKKLPKPIIATENNQKDKSSFSYEDPDDPRYDSTDMPEYGVETKADFKGNQEAADWLMHDPNKFNVMPDEDTKTLFSDDNKESSKDSSDDPIRLDNNDSQHTEYQSFNDDDQEAYAKIQESLAPDSNLGKIYSKYEKFLNQFDQKLREKNKNTETQYDFDANEDDVGNDVGESNDVTTSVNNDGNEMNADSGHAQNSDLRLGNLNKKKEKDFNSEDRFGNQSDENKAEKLKEAEELILKNEESKINLLKELQEKIKFKEEKQEHFKNNQEEPGTLSNQSESEDAAEETHGRHETNSSASSNQNDNEDTAGQESSRHDNKSNNKIDVTLSKSGSRGVPDGLRLLDSDNVLPIYRISHLHKDHKGGRGYVVSPKAGVPMTEQGTSRQNVDMNRESFSMSNYQLPTSNQYSGITQMMLSKIRNDHSDSQKINIVEQSNGKPLHLNFNPQEPQDGQGRHGIPTRFGYWNGWSECSVSCGTGSQIRARICLRLPCQSRDLYQTRNCARSVCPGKWRKESLLAHNRIRELHHSPPLVWSNSLAKRAKQLADNLASRDYIGSQDLHEEKGENIAQLHQIKNNNLLAQKAVDLWYDEIKSYSFSYPELSPQNRHFIQMVWKQTKTLGMASTQSPSGEYTFVVALYGGPDINEKHLHDNVFRAGEKHDVYTTFKRSGQSKSKPR